jgi:hypothetical protein
MFANWADYIAEFHSVCQQGETDTDASIDNTGTEIEAAEIRQQRAKERVDEAEKAANFLKGQVEMATDEYKKANDKFPTW